MRASRRSFYRPTRGFEQLEQRRLLSVTSVAFEQITPKLEVADMNLESAGLMPSHLTLLGDSLFFIGDDGIHGRELWITDLVAGSTAMVKDVLRGEESAFSVYPSHYQTTAVLGDMLLFVAEDAQGNYALWKSDGTDSGTVFVQQLPHRPTEMVAANGKLFLSVFTELWVSDGTAGGTMSLADVVYGPEGLTQVGETLFFSSTTALWISDGSVAGTQIVKDVKASDLANINGTLYFAGDSDEVGHGVELWKSDGTPDGTVEIKDIRPGETQVGPPGPQSSRPSAFTYYDSETFFLVRGNVWRTDGTEPGTVPVSNESADDLFAFNDQLYVIRGDGIKLVGVDDFITPPMYLIRDLTIAEDVFYFGANTTDHGRELWRSDGTSAGTVLVADIHVGPTSGIASHVPLVVMTNAAYFSADDGTIGTELWKSDTAGMGAAVVYDYGKGSSSDPHHLTVVGDNLFFTADDGVTPSSQLWVANDLAADLLIGLPQPQKLIDDPTYPGSVSEDLINLIDVGGDLVFTHYFTYVWASANWQHEFELWTSDGTTEGTQLLKPSYYSFFPELGPEYGPVYQEVQNGNLYFELGRYSGDWPRIEAGRYDGLVVEELTLTGLTDPSQYRAVDGQLFFSAVSEGYGRELWVTTDGFQTYQRLSDTDDILRPRLIVSPNFSELVAFDGQLFFTAGIDSREIAPHTTESFVSELWKSNGTVAGTTRVIAVGDESHLANLTVVDDKLFFTTASQPALWVSDGTIEGTVMLRQFEQIGSEFVDGNLDVLCEWAACPPQVGVEFVEFNGQLYFAGDNGDGLELWRSDGTVAGTELVADILPGQGGSNPASFVVAGNLLFFAANDGAHGRELWLSDGTAIGTRIYADILPGPFSSDPSELTAMGDELYFSADDGIRGEELWRSDTTLHQPLIGDADGNWKVEFADFLRLSHNYGLVVEDGPRSGDFNRNGIVDFADFLLLSSNFGNERQHSANLSPVFHLDFSSFTDTSENGLPVIVGDAVSLAPHEGPVLENGKQLDAARWHDEASPANQILIPDNAVLDQVSVGAGSIVTWLKPDDGDAWNSILKTICPDQEPCAAFGPGLGIEFNATGPHAGVFGGVQGWQGGFEGSANVFGPLAPVPFGVHPSATDTPSGEWTHVALTWDELGERTVYVNGIPGPRRIGGFADGASFGRNNVGDWSIGGDGLPVASDRGNPDQSRRLEGLLADFAIFELELEANQISEIVRNGVAKFGA